MAYICNIQEQRMKNILKIALILLLIQPVQSAFGWGMTGHRVIAEIAERHLNKKAKKNIKQIIGNQKLAYWSNWADFIKSDPDPVLNTTGSWHFVNAPGNLNYVDFVQVLQESPDHNLYKAYLRIKEDAIKNQGTQVEKQQQLYYILHLLADAHQPMHVGRPEDLGGNTIDITFFGRRGNLHRLWDTDLVDNEKYSFTEYASLLDINKRDYKQIAQGSTFEEWLYDSHQVANKIYADIAQNTDLSYNYVYSFKYVMEECLLKAGLRLAKELNEIYG